MSTYMLSRFNIFHMLDDASLLIYNTLAKKVIKIPFKNENVIQILHHNELEKLSKKEQDFLLEQGIIIEVDYDEKKIAEYKFYNTIFSPETIDITILPTNACNFDCIYCYQEKKNDYMSIETADTIINYIDKITQKGVRVLSLGWFGGEPMMAFDIVLHVMRSVKKICQKNHVILLSRMTTNGYNLCVEKFKELLVNGVRYLQITVDGTREIHNRQRPLYGENSINTYDIIMKNLIDISKLKDFYEIGLRINITPQMNEYKNEILETMATYFKNRRFVMLYEWVRDWGGERVQNNAEVISDSEIIIDWITKSKSKGMYCSDKLLTGWDTHFCEACKLNGFVIDWDAQVYKCAMAIYKKEYQEVNLLGYINKKGEMIKNDNIPKWIVKNEDSSCDNCVYYPLCFNAGCPFKSKIQGQKSCVPYKNSIKNYMEVYDAQDNVIIMR